MNLSYCWHNGPKKPMKLCNLIVLKLLQGWLESRQRILRINTYKSLHFRLVASFDCKLQLWSVWRYSRQCGLLYSMPIFDAMHPIWHIINDTNSCSVLLSHSLSLLHKRSGRFNHSSFFVPLFLSWFTSQSLSVSDFLSLISFSLSALFFYFSLKFSIDLHLTAFLLSSYLFVFIFSSFPSLSLSFSFFPLWAKFSLRVIWNRNGVDLALKINNSSL